MSSLEELKKEIEARKGTVTIVNRGLTPLSLLGIAFIVLKVMGYITWSWWWVLAPFWIPIVLAVLLLLIVFLFLCIVSVKAESVNVVIDETPKEEPEPEPEVTKEETPKKKTTRKSKKSKKDAGSGTEGKNE